MVQFIHSYSIITFMPGNNIVLDKWMWLIEIAIGIVIIVSLSLILKKIVKTVKKRTSKKEGMWAKKVHKIIHMPLQIAIWGFGVAYIVDVFGTHFGFPGIARYVRPLKVAFIVVCFSWIGLRWIKEVFNHLAKKSEKLGVAPSTMYALNKLSSFVLSIIALIIIFQIFGLNVLPLLTFGGIGVAGLAFAAKDIIGNFFGGAMLHLTRNFSVNDQVVIPAQNNFEGVVKEIGWYITVVEDYYRRPVYFPNALFAKTQVINASRRNHRRIKETISIRYDDIPNLEKIVEELQEKVGAHPQVDNTQSFSITFTKFGNHGLEIYLYLLIYQMPYVKFLRAQQEVLMIVREVVSKYGAEFCYPTMTVNLAQTPPQG